MVKLMILGRRAPGITRAKAQYHLMHVHGRLVLLPPADAGAMPCDYAQNHVIDGTYPAQGAHAIERDLLTEIWFDDMRSLQASTSTPYYLANLKPDEPRFVDDASVVKMLVRPEILVDGPKGVVKIFTAIGLTDAGLDDVAKAVDRIGTHLARASGSGALVVNTVLPPPDGRPPFAHLIFESWSITEVDARRLADVATTFGDDLADLIDPDRSLSLLAEEFTAGRLKALFEHGAGAA